MCLCVHVCLCSHFKWLLFCSIVCRRRLFSVHEANMKTISDWKEIPAIQIAAPLPSWIQLPVFFLFRFVAIPSHCLNGVPYASSFFDPFESFDSLFIELVISPPIPAATVYFTSFSFLFFFHHWVYITSEKIAEQHLYKIMPPISIVKRNSKSQPESERNTNLQLNVSV